MFSSIDFRKIIIGVVICGSMGIGITFGHNNWTEYSHTAWYSIWYAKFAKWSCTDYVASRRKDLFPSRNGKDRLFWWNAISRLSNAKKAWVPTGKRPEVWAIAVFGKWRGASSSYGHVAIVEEIIDEKTIIITDMNYSGPNKITRRTISGKLALGYIYHLIQHDTANENQNKTNIITLALSSQESKKSIDTQVWSMIKNKDYISSLPSGTLLDWTRYSTWDLNNNITIGSWDIQISLVLYARSSIKELYRSQSISLYTAMTNKERYNNTPSPLWDTW